MSVAPSLAVPVTGEEKRQDEARYPDHSKGDVDTKHQSRRCPAPLQTNPGTLDGGGVERALPSADDGRVAARVETGRLRGKYILLWYIV